MIKFVVYDDEEVFRSNIVSCINKVIDNNKIDYKIEEFSKYNSRMQKVIDEDCPKIYILDIEIPNGLSGIDVARKIRVDDWNSIIILVTSHVDMGYDALKAQIMLLDFISKYNDCNRNIEKTVKKALLKIDNKKVLIFESNDITYKVYTDDIVYIVKDTIDRKCIIKTVYNEISINENISTLFDMLDNRFFMTHRSCIVNTEKIDRIDWRNNIVYFKNGFNTDYLSRDRKKEFKAYVRGC
ncbi:MAG: response regulator transcription factor [Lactobacillales bacterium]|nr:response regulator transcription factor [Lactobacillales bacterium]